MEKSFGVTFYPLSIILHIEGDRSISGMERWGEYSDGKITKCISRTRWQALDFFSIKGTSCVTRTILKITLEPFIPDYFSTLRPNDRATLIDFSKGMGNNKRSQQSSTIFSFSFWNCNKYTLRIFFTSAVTTDRRLRDRKKKKKKKIMARSWRIDVNAIRTRARLTSGMRSETIVCFRSFHNANDLSKRETK